MRPFLPVVQTGDTGTIQFRYCNRCSNRAHSYDHALAKAYTSAGAGDCSPMYFVNSWVQMKLSVWPVFYVIITYYMLLLHIYYLTCHYSLLLFLLLHCCYIIIMYYYINHFYVLLLFLLLHSYYIIITYHYTIHYYILWLFCYYTVITSLLHIIAYSLCHNNVIICNYNVILKQGVVRLIITSY